MGKNDLESQIFTIEKRIQTLQWDLSMISNDEQKKIKQMQLNSSRSKLNLLKKELPVFSDDE